MQTRGARKRAADASLLAQRQASPKITSIFGTTKRTADVGLGDAKLQEERPAKRTRTDVDLKKVLPINELPHGLGLSQAPKSQTPRPPTIALNLPDGTSGLVSTSSPEKNVTECASAGENPGQTLSETCFSPITALSAVESVRGLRPRPKSHEDPAGWSITNDTPEDLRIPVSAESADIKKTSDQKSERTPKRTKENPYGLMPGQTPFPDWPAPSPEDCVEVHRILTELHGAFTPPEKIPAPSTSVAGCGEVPDIVDALIRTLISGHTSMQNANLAIQDVTAKYGQWDADSIGAGSIAWNKVRLSEESEVVDAVKRAGLGPTKGRDIKSILDMVHRDNQVRLAAYITERETGEMADILGAQNLTQGQKDHQVKKMESGILTLDHVRGLTSDEAMLEFTKYPGIGVKTSSCLILFCLQQPSFAVDTHVWRFCKWLKWVPPKASRDDTYMHGEVRIPDTLKYGLHQLFIRHGKECGRCRSITVEGTADWDNATCPLEDLLDRFDKRKTKRQARKTKASSEQKPLDREAGEDEAEQGQKKDGETREA
ncbi:hypothetical protein BN1708_002926, partial [Verticillium longisporum]